MSRLVRVLWTVRGEGPFYQNVAYPGLYEAHVNQHGAVSVRAGNGQLLGVKPDEFEWVRTDPIVERFDLLAHLQRQSEWSRRTFGPGKRAKGVVDHIRKELAEIEAEPHDLKEWIDVVLLAFDGAGRSGASPEQIVQALIEKQAKNEKRVWPDWRTQPLDKAIEHDRTAEAP